MTTLDFIGEIQVTYEKELPPETVKIWDKFLRQFPQKDLERLLDKVQKTCKQPPKLAHVYDAAVELKLLGARETADEALKKALDRSHWEVSLCKKCNGEGLLSVRFEYWLKDGEWMRQLKRLAGASSPERGSWPGAEPGCYDFIFRCSCESGNRPGLPKSWPRWKDSESDKQAQGTVKAESAQMSLEQIQAKMAEGEKPDTRPKPPIYDDEIPF